MPGPNENQPANADSTELEDMESGAEPDENEGARFGGLHEMSNKPGGQGGTPGSERD